MSDQPLYTYTDPTPDNFVGQYVSFEYGPWDASGHECGDIDPNHSDCDQPVMQRTVTAVYVDRRVPLGVELEPHTAHVGRDVGPVYESAEELADALAAEQKRNAALQRLLTDAEQEITALHQERGRSLEARRELDDANSTIRQLLQQRKDLRRERDAAFEDAARSMRERAIAALGSPQYAAAAIRALPLIPDDDESTETATVHAATPEGITPCGQGTRDVTTTARIADATCLECLSTLAQAETAGRGDEGSTAPRDSDLIQAVRALVKRYGAPAVAYEAARQARHE